MKICIITNIYPPFDRGGAEQVVKKTVEALLAAQHDVVIITGTPDKEEVEKKDRLTIHRIKPVNLFFYTHGGQHHAATRLLWHIIDTFNIVVARRVERILLAEHPDVVHTHNLMGLSFLIPRIIRALRLRHIHTVHDVQLVEPSAMILKQFEHTARYNGLPTRVYTSVMKRLMGSPDVVISPSQFLLNFYRERGFFPSSTQVVLRNPLTVDIVPAIAPKQHEPVRFLYLCQIEYHKGILFLLDTFLRKKDMDAELHIVGDGSCFKEMAEKARGDNRVRVYGRIDRNTLPQLFEKIDMTIVPSLCYENSPTVIFESFAFGVPVLASNIEGVAELIREGENGVTFEAGGADSLQKKMQSLVENTSLIEHMSAQSTKSLEGLSSEEYMKRLVELY